MRRDQVKPKLVLALHAAEEPCYFKAQSNTWQCIIQTSSCKSRARTTATVYRVRILITR